MQSCRRPKALSLSRKARTVTSKCHTAWEGAQKGAFCGPGQERPPLAPFHWPELSHVPQGAWEWGQEEVLGGLEPLAPRGLLSWQDLSPDLRRPGLTALILSGMGPGTTVPVESSLFLSPSSVTFSSYFPPIPVLSPIARTL